MKPMSCLIFALLLAAPARADTDNSVVDVMRLLPADAKTKASAPARKPSATAKPKPAAAAAPAHLSAPVMPPRPAQETPAAQTRPEGWQPATPTAKAKPEAQLPSPALRASRDAPTGLPPAPAAPVPAPAAALSAKPYGDLAVFWRFGYWWAASSEPLHLAKAAGVEEILPVKATGGFAVRMKLSPTFEPHVEAVKGGGLTLTAAAILNDPKDGFAPVPLPASNRVDIMGAGFGRPVSFVDPEVGDVLVAVPSAQRLGMAQDRVYPLFAMLPTVSGLALAPRSAKVVVARGQDGVSVTAVSGALQISEPLPDVAPVLERAVAAESIYLADAENPAWRDWLHLAKHAAPSGAKARETGRDLAYKTSMAGGEERAALRLARARFHLAQSEGAEALAMLNLLTAQDAEAAATPQVMAARGTAAWLMGRHGEARKIFSPTYLKANREVMLFDAASASALGAHEEAYPFFKRLVGTVRDMPAGVRARLALAGAATSIAQGDDALTASYLALAAGDPLLTNYQKAGVAYYTGLASALTGGTAAAAKKLAEALASPSLYYSARAAREAVDLKVRLGDMKESEALARLETLRYGWRGDRYEYDLGMDIASRYLAEGRKDLALRMLGSLAATFAGTDFGRDLPARMADIFRGIFLGPTEEIGQIPAIKQIAAFEDFKELVPSGALGLQVRQRAADLMAYAGFYPRAAALLEAQLKSGAEASARPALGARLALMRLLNRQPAEAADALDATEPPAGSAAAAAVSRAVRDMRRNIRAEALIDTGRYDEALRLVDDGATEEALALKAEVLWRQGKYGAAADALRGLIKKPNPANGLEPGQAEIVLNWAAALRMAGRESVIQRLRAAFTPLMAATEYAEAFDLITGPTAPDLAKLGADAETARRFRVFAARWTDLARDSRLSQTVQ